MKKEFIKADFRGKKEEEIIHNAVREGKLDAYLIHPETGDPIKIPKELAKRMANGESISWECIFNYKQMN